MPRLNFIFVFAAFSLALAAPAHSGDYPLRPVEVYVGGSAGGSLDAVMRTLAPSFEKRFGQPLVVIDKPGAYGIIAANAAMSAQPDGYRISTITPGALQALEDTHDPGNDPKRLSFITGLVTFPLIMVVDGAGPIKSVADLIASKPDFWGTANTIGMIGGASFLEAAHLKDPPQRMYFRGKEPEMLLMIIRKDLPFAIMNAPGALGLIRDGKIRPIAVFAKRRSSFFPDTPTLVEALAAAGKKAPRGVREPSLGLAAPAQTPASRIETLSQGFRAILEEPDVRARLAKILAEPTDWDGRNE